MNTAFNRTRSFIISAQAAAVFFAFALMTGTSYFFVSRIENENLRKMVKESIYYTEANIKAAILELETNLAGVSQTICGMIMRGDSAETIQGYLPYINNYVQNNKKKRLSSVIGFYGIFDVYGKTFTAGDAGLLPSEEYALQDYPWYKAAVDADGDIGITRPYIDTATGKGFITFSCRIFDEDGIPLGIVCLDINLDQIGELAVNAHFSEKSYGFLLNENMEIIAHPVPSTLGMLLYDANLGIAASDAELRRYGYVSEFKVISYMGVESVLYIEELYNGWYMGVVTPRVQYYRSTRTLAIILIALGTIMAVLLITMLIRISAEKNKADERMQIMFNTIPFGASMQRKDLSLIDCNEAVVKLFNLSGKQEYFDRISDLSPEYQPDGRQSMTEVGRLAGIAFSEGYCHFEWMHQNLNGEQIPCEVTLVRVEYNNDFVLAVYARDLREIKTIMKGIEYREHLLNMVNTLAGILLSNKDESTFYDSLMKSFGLIGYCLDIDRVQIWRNEITDGELNFVHRYEWLSDYGRRCGHVPIGLSVPYHEHPDWKNMFLRGEYINSPVCDLPYDSKSFLSTFKIKSIVMIPLILEDNFWGFFSIDDCHSERTFLNEEIHILTSVGLMMSNAINRNLQIVKMREADERMRIMFNTMPLGAGYYNKYFEVIDCNEVMVKIHGLSSKQEYISKFLKLSPEYQPDGRLSSEKMAEYFSLAFMDGYCHVEWTHCSLEGEMIPCEVILVRVEHNGELIVTAYVRDLRELKTTIAAKEQAEQSSRFKSQFLSRMSHEIRTPMNAILGITEMQLQNQSIPGDIHEAFGKINDSGYLLLGIINDILDLSKIEAGKLDMVARIYDIANLIGETVNLNIIKYDSKPIEFSLIVDENIPAELIGDEIRIKQVLNNLLSNAFKYTDTGSISMSVHAECPQQEDSSRLTLVFRVADTGHGMTPDQVEHLFDEYVRFNMQTNRLVEGAGLGMSITKQLVDLMNGDIFVESEPYKGSIFTVCLPQETTGSDVLGKETANNLMQLLRVNTQRVRKASQITYEYMPYGRVLIVDDMETNIYVARGLMSPYCLSIETARSGFEAVEKIKSGSKFDIIFMDHFMPRMDGIETTKIIRDLGYTRPIIALTANALAGVADMFIGNGFDGFIPKPIDLRQLNSLLNKLIRDKYPPEVVEAAQKQAVLIKNSASAKKQQTSELELKMIFTRDAKRVVERVGAIYKNSYRRTGDIRQFVIDVHAMKSALASIGEPLLSDAAFELEKAGREENMLLMKEKTPAFLEALRAVIEKNKQDEDDVEVKNSDSDMEFLAEKILVVQKACGEYDEMAANAALAELGQKKWSHSVKETLGAISEYLLHSDFEEAANAAGDYIKNNISHYIRG